MDKKKKNDEDYMVPFKHNLAIPKFLVLRKIDSKDFGHLKLSHALLFLNLV